MNESDYVKQKKDCEGGGGYSVIPDSTIMMEPRVEAGGTIGVCLGAPVSVQLEG